MENKEEEMNKEKRSRRSRIKKRIRRIRRRRRRGAQIPGDYFCTVATNICGPSIWKLLHVTLLGPRFCKSLYSFHKFVYPCPTILNCHIFHFNHQ